MSEGTKRRIFNLPPKEEQRPPRPGSKRHVVFELVRVGCTVDEVIEATGWSSRYAKEAIRLLHTRHGYGLSEDEHGVVQLLAC